MSETVHSPKLTPQTAPAVPSEEAAVVAVPVPPPPPSWAPALPSLATLHHNVDADLVARPAHQPDGHVSADTASTFETVEPTALREVPAEPDPATIFKRKVSLLHSIREVWAHRELVRSLVERDLRSRYKQAFLGFAWTILTPVTLMLVFTIFFKRVANIDTGDVPYALFSYIGLLPWGFFSTSISTGGMSLITNGSLLNKVYCPREVFPIAGMFSALADTLFSSSALILLFAVQTFAPKATSYWVPLLLLVQLVFMLGMVLLFSSVVVYLRDLRHLLPIILQLGLFATPVAYPITEIPESWRGVYAALNPMAPVIDGYRRAVLYGQAPQWGLLGLGAITSVVMVIIGYRVFKRLETGIADVA